MPIIYIGGRNSKYHILFQGAFADGDIARPASSEEEDNEALVEEPATPSPAPPKKSKSDKIDPTDTMNPFGNK